MAEIKTGRHPFLGDLGAALQQGHCFDQPDVGRQVTMGVRQSLQSAGQRLQLLHFSFELVQQFKGWKQNAGLLQVGCLLLFPIDEERKPHDQLVEGCLGALYPDLRCPGCGDTGGFDVVAEVVVELLRVEVVKEIDLSELSGELALVGAGPDDSLVGDPCLEGQLNLTSYHLAL